MHARPTGRFLPRLPALLAPLLLTACQPAILSPQGPVGIAEKAILIDSVGIMLAIVLPTIAATAGFAWWFRAGNIRAKYRPHWVYSGQIELIVWGIPALTIMLLGGVAWVGSHDLDPYRPLPSKTPPLDIQAVSLDWKWLFIYPGQHIATVNQLIVPQGVPLHFSLTSASVMNAFFVPSLGSMIYTMNGMATQLNLQADAPGIFHGLSSHYSGDGFSGMHFDVRSVPPGQFAAWVDAARGKGPELDAAGYMKLEQQSLDVKPFTYGNVEPDLFQRIMTQALPPGPGPRTDTPQQAVSPHTEQ